MCFTYNHVVKSRISGSVQNIRKLNVNKPCTQNIPNVCAKTVHP